MNFVLFCRHANFLRYMEAQVEFFKTQSQHERARAEVAIAELLRLKVGSAALMPNLVTAITAEEEIEKLQANPEFAHAGTME